jgi:hypothetical protein
VVDASEAAIPCRCDKALRAAPVRTALADVAKVLNTSFASTAAAETAALICVLALAKSFIKLSAPTQELTFYNHEYL